MADAKKNLDQLRAEVRGMMASIHVAPSRMCRADLERMKEIYGAAAEKNKTLPHPVKRHGGRTKASEVEGDEKEGVLVPKKIVKEKTQYAIKKEKKTKAVAQPAKVVSDDLSSKDDSDSDIEVVFQPKGQAKAEPPPKPKRVLSADQKAKMAAGRAAKKQPASTSTPAPPPAPAPAPADSTTNNSETHINLPVFRLG